MVVFEKFQTGGEVKIVMTVSSSPSSRSQDPPVNYKDIVLKSDDELSGVDTKQIEDMVDEELRSETQADRQNEDLYNNGNTSDMNTAKGEDDNDNNNDTDDDVNEDMYGSYKKIKGNLTPVTPDSSQTPYR